MTEIEKVACDFTFRGWPPELWLSPLDVRRELNRDDIGRTEDLGGRKTEDGRLRTEENSSYSSVLIPPSFVLAMAPGRLDRVLESLEQLLVVSC